MKKKNIPASVASTNAYEPLEDWARSRVQVWLQELLEDEVTQFLGREKSERSPNRRGYRNGHGKPRRFAMMNGTMEVRRPRVRNTAERFEKSDPAVFSTEIETAGRATSRALPPRSGHRGLRAGNAPGFSCRRPRDHPIENPDDQSSSCCAGSDLSNRRRHAEGCVDQTSGSDTGRVRTDVLSAATVPPRRGGTQLKLSPENPGWFKETCVHLTQESR